MDQIDSSTKKDQEDSKKNEIIGIVSKHANLNEFCSQTKDISKETLKLRERRTKVKLSLLLSKMTSNSHI